MDRTKELLKSLRRRCRRRKPVLDRRVFVRDYQDLAGADLIRALGGCLRGALVMTGPSGEVRYANQGARRLLRIAEGDRIAGWLDGLGSRTGDLANEIVYAACVQHHLLVSRKACPGGHLYLIEPAGDPSAVPDRSGRDRAPYTFEDIIGLNALKKKARHLAVQRVNILIMGESGTGKELFAAAIHNAAPRTGGRFVPVNCGAIPASLFETELFGHTRGAFTDARADRTGKIEHAQRGTLFFDEIGDLPADVQGKLLRVLETRRVCPLGGNEETEIDARFIFATNRDLAGMVGQGRFREDLYYRISPVTIRIPPLRERKEELPALIDHMLAKVQQGHGRFTTGLTEEALASLVEYDYPGNVRELEGIIRNAYLTCPAERIGPDDLGLDRARIRTLRQKIEDYRRRVILDKLGQNRGDVRRTAADLRISVRSIYRYVNQKEGTSEKGVSRRDQ